MHRRPLETRSKGWAKSIAAFLVRLRISPNGISAMSVAFGCLTFYLLAFPQPWPLWKVYLLAAVTIQLRLLCNMLDGMVAVEGGLQSPLGGLFNEVPDRLTDTLTLAGAGLACAHLPLGVELGLVASVIAMFTAYIRVLGASLGTTSAFHGPMAKPHRMAAMTGFLVLGSFEVANGGPGHMLLAALWLITVGSVVTCLRRLKVISAELNAMPQG